MVTEEARSVTSRAFSAYMKPLEMVTSFKYLGRVLLAADDDWPSVVQKFVKAQMVWQRISSILIMKGARPRVSGFFFKAVVHSVLIFVANTWVVNPHMGRALGNYRTRW